MRPDAVRWHQSRGGRGLHDPPATFFSSLPLDWGPERAKSRDWGAAPQSKTTLFRQLPLRSHDYHRRAPSLTASPSKSVLTLTLRRRVASPCSCSVTVETQVQMRLLLATPGKLIDGGEQVALGL